MDEGDANSELRRRIAEIDAQVESPEVRADRIWRTLRRAAPNETNWDVLCFCIEFVGMLVPEFPWLEDVAKPLAIRVHTAHYAKEGLYDVFARTTESQDRSTDVIRRNQTDSNRIILESGFIGGSKKNISSSIHLRDNPAQSAKDGSSQAVGDDECRGTGGDEG